MGTAAFVAFLMSLCNQRFTATQFALLSAFASVGRVWVGPLAGVLAQSIGWPAFFIVSIVAALPALALLRCCGGRSICWSAIRMRTTSPVAEPRPLARNGSVCATCSGPKQSRSKKNGSEPSAMPSARRAVVKESVLRACRCRV